jgi:Zn finger protein HypA/HybF involved in hydrogenase expression
MTKKSPKMEMFCQQCSQYAKPDPNTSSANWDVLPPNCPTCGGKWTIKLGGQHD